MYFAQLFLLNSLYAKHLIKKWNSILNSAGQKGHVISPTYIFSYLPHDIMRILKPLTHLCPVAQKNISVVCLMVPWPVGSFGSLFLENLGKLCNVIGQNRHTNMKGNIAHFRHRANSQTCLYVVPIRLLVCCILRPQIISSSFFGVFGVFGTGWKKLFLRAATKISFWAGSLLR